MSDETSITKAEVTSEAEEALLQPAVDEKKTPKRTPKRRSFIERAQRESEELVRTMGGSLELEGGRRTRSSTRGTPTRAADTVTPPPSKRARSSPSTGKSGGRGRGARKLDVDSEAATEEKEPLKPVKAAPPAIAAVKAKIKQKVEEPAKSNDKNDEKKATESSKDQLDTAAPATEENQNNIDHDKKEENTKKSEEEDKESEELEKTEDPPSAAMDVDNEPDKQPEQVEITKVVTASNDVEPTAVTETTKAGEEAQAAPESAPLQEPETSVEAKETKEPTPEPMEVDAITKGSDTDIAANAIPAAKSGSLEAVDETATTASISTSNTIAEVKEAAPTVDTETNPSANSAAVTAEASTENNASTDAASTANNDVNDVKQAPVAVTVTEPVVQDAEPVVVKSPPADPVVNNEGSKSEHKDNGEPKIVKMDAEAANDSNHTTPQACN